MSADPLHLLIGSGPLAVRAHDGAQWSGRARLGGGASLRDAPRVHMLLAATPISVPAAEDDLRWSGARIAQVGTVRPERAAALLCNFLDVADSAEEEFNAWYDTEHLPRLGALPGVEGIARFRSTQSPRYLALFALAAADVAAGEAWLAAARTPWTTRIKRFTHGYRSLLFTDKTSYYSS
ncbi:MAG TPA: hypothetical protein VNQ31_04940 [Sphingomonadaceae bacterium]|nr:hypothetical protein [Sphingomonadaceae bacterium]